MISLDDDKIPEGLWKLFPPKGQYLNNILVYSGYETYDSIMKLKEETEINEALSFVKGLNDIMDEKEKQEMFGIFSKYPEKLMVLPGLKPVLSTFIKSVEKLKIPTIETPIAKKNNNKTKRSNEKHSSPSAVEVIEPLVRKLCSWLKKQKHFKTNFVILKERI